jgi:drug/metabolite transporter (DMT)-like permease
VPAVLALLSSLMWGAADFLGGSAARRLPAVTVVVLSQATALGCLLPLVLLSGPPPVGDVAGPAVLAGLVGPAALLAFYRALAIGTMGVVAPIGALGVVVPVLSGLAAGESPRTAQLAGMGVAVVGVVLACGPELRGAGEGGAASLVLALIAALGFGTVFVLLADGAGSGDGGVAQVLLVLLVMRVTSVTVLGLVVGARALLGGARARGTGEPVGRALPVLAVIGLLDVGANGTYAVATQTDLVSVTAVLASLYPVVTGLLAWRLLGERLRGLQWAGVALAMTGVLLLAGG